MKIVRFNGGRIGVVNGHDITDVTSRVGVDVAEWPPVGMTRVIADFSNHKGALSENRAGDPAFALDQVRLETPVPWPNKLIAIPVNYVAHALEMSSPAISRNAGFFIKSNSSLSGAGESIVLPDLPGREIHHEAELGVIIGREARHVSRGQALSHVFGYTCLLDITVRGKQERAMRKSFDSFTPVGPWIVTADEVVDPSDLDVKLWVNDQLRQSANTRDMIVDVPEIIAMTSAVMTLYPGDVIATGTSEGVGPIVAGDTVTIEISRVGRMAVRVVQGKGGASIAMPYQLS
jgi:2-keto-4-pentenoate hydratase/2-oxohepta-3-ene-1,7-dioic acid hydratase in catechol pathway